MIIFASTPNWSARGSIGGSNHSNSSSSMSIRLVPRSDSSSESSSDEEMNREDMRGRGPRRPKKQRDPYSSPFYRHYIVNADQNGPDVEGSVWDQHSELATGFRRRFGLPYVHFDTIYKDWNENGEYRAEKGLQSILV
mmetsp:Transcript_1821/g.4136  ORF Transcript_1821/g.4136 Transcript_1821/m.4136 type:complete len:138 (-) Transcript_1821:470-883(-)